jgi:putative ABC transport system permease protein
MIKNYILVAVRNLFKNKSASFINILGLAIGLCSCLLIGIYIQHELNYDRFEKKGDRFLVILIAFITVSTQVFRAAIANPVTSLRAE